MPCPQVTFDQRYSKKSKSECLCMWPIKYPPGVWSIIVHYIRHKFTQGVNIVPPPFFVNLEVEINNKQTRASVHVTGVIILYRRFVTVETNPDPWKGRAYIVTLICNLEKEWYRHNYRENINPHGNSTCWRKAQVTQSRWPHRLFPGGSGRVEETSWGGAEGWRGG